MIQFWTSDRARTRVFLKTSPNSSYFTLASGGYIIRMRPAAMGMFVVPDWNRLMKPTAAERPYFEAWDHFFSLLRPADSLDFFRIPLRDYQARFPWNLTARMTQASSTIVSVTSGWTTVIATSGFSGSSARDGKHGFSSMES